MKQPKRGDVRGFQRRVRGRREHGQIDADIDEQQSIN